MKFSHFAIAFTIAGSYALTAPASVLTTTTATSLTTTTTTKTTTTTAAIGGCAGVEASERDQCCVQNYGQGYVWNDYEGKCVSSTTTPTPIPTDCRYAQYPDDCCAQKLCDPRAVYDWASGKCVVQVTCGDTQSPDQCCVQRFGPGQVWSPFYNCCVPIKTVIVTVTTVTVPCQQCPITTKTITSTSTSTCPPTITYTTLTPTYTTPIPPQTTNLPPPPTTSILTCAPVTITSTKTCQVSVTIFVPAQSCIGSTIVGKPSCIS